MKKIKKSMLLLIVFVTVIISSTSCKKKVYIDVDKCAEVALEYVKTKYNEDFEVVYKHEVRRVFGSAGYVEVDVRIKGKEKEYCVIVYPDKKKKNDKAYVSYKVVSDDYMCELVKQNVKLELDNIIKEMGINRFISEIYVDEIGEVKGFHGFSSDFYINEENNTLQGLLDNRCIDISYIIEVPESEFNSSYKNSITELLYSKISGDIISVYIKAYSEDTYTERENVYKEKGYEQLNDLITLEDMYILIKEDETNESK